MLALEVGALKMGYYLLSDGAAPPSLVLLAWSGYKFAGLCVNLLAFLALGTAGYYVALAYNAICMAFFLRGVMRVSWLPSSRFGRKKKRLALCFDLFVTVRLLESTFGWLSCCYKESFLCCWDEKITIKMLYR